MWMDGPYFSEEEVKSEENVKFSSFSSITATNLA